MTKERDTIKDLTGDEPVWCPKCNYNKQEGCCERAKEIEVEQERQRLSIEGASLGGLRAVREYTAEAFNTSYQTVGLREKFRLAYDAVTNFKAEKDNLFLYGPSGCGKTHLGTIALRGVHPSLRSIVRGSDFSRAILESQKAGKPLPFMNAKVLLIDDISKCSASDAYKEYLASGLWSWFDSWLNQDRGGLIITSNMDFGQLSASWGDDSIISRIAGICEGKVFGFNGAKDIRLQRRDK